MKRWSHYNKITRTGSPRSTIARWAAAGQSTVEYALIGTLVVLAIGAAITLMKGPVGNIFSNTVFNVLGGTSVPYSTLTFAQLQAYQAKIGSNTPSTPAFTPNTPAAPTCSPAQTRTFAPTDSIIANAGTFIAAPCP
jgi:Flp pilus assembly pilin Flp